MSPPVIVSTTTVGTSTNQVREGEAMKEASRSPDRRRFPAASGIRVVRIAALLCGAGVEGTADAQAPAPVDPARELMIVHPSVVDPFLNGGRSHNGSADKAGGVWSLRTLLSNLVHEIWYQESERNDFYASFFEQWLSTQTADNGDAVAPRDQDRVRQLILDQFSTVNPGTGKRVFQLWKLPFELIAIAYRPDLRPSDGSDGGELRFVYKLVGPDGENLRFTLIMEYALKTTDLGLTPQDWAHNFHRLATLELGSEAYLDQLQRVTYWNTSFFFTDPPHIRHIRTNELVLDASPEPLWQLREFVVIEGPVLPKRVLASSVDNTPKRSLNRTDTLASFITANPVLSAPGTGFMSFVMPEQVQTPAGLVNFLDTTSEVDIDWAVPSESSVPPVAVDNLGLLTCNGCHQSNKSTEDIDFYHVQPDISPGQTGAARLSKFLTAPDPLRADRLPGELNRRKSLLTDLLDEPCDPYWIP